jgi:hypothetical protein
MDMGLVNVPTTPMPRHSVCKVPGGSRRGKSKGKGKGGQRGRRGKRFGVKRYCVFYTDYGANIEVQKPGGASSESINIIGGDSSSSRNRNGNTTVTSHKQSESESVPKNDTASGHEPI